MLILTHEWTSLGGECYTFSNKTSWVQSQALCMHRILWKKKKTKNKMKETFKANHHALKCWAYWGTQAQANPPIQWLDHQVVWFSSGSTHFQLKWWTKPDQGLVDRPIGQTVWSGPLFKTLIFLSSWIIRVIYTCGLYGHIG